MISTIGELVRSLRQERGLSCRALAGRAGVTHRTILNWETGKFLPRLPELEQVLAALAASKAARRQALDLLDRPRAIAQIHTQIAQTLTTGDTVGRGDLLRALRQRRGRTLEQVAAVLGVAPRTVSRWERDTHLPSVLQVHAYCQAMAATPEEVALLTLEWEPPGEGNLWERLQAVLIELWAYPQPAAKVARTELTLLAMATQLQAMTWRDPATLSLLAEVYATLANYYYVTDYQPRRVLHFAQQTMHLARSLPRLPHPAVAGIARYASVAPPGAAIRALAFWSDFVPDISCLAWFLSLQAESASRRGAVAEAEHYSVRSLELTKDDAPEYEYVSRQHNRAKLLLGWNRAAEALPLLGPVRPDTSAPTLLLHSRAALAQGDRPRAAHLLQEVFLSLERRGDTWENMAPLIRREATPLVKTLA